jgi:CheY-like chemotaxis protein
MIESPPLDILLVDDHPDSLGFLARLLGTQGWRVRTAGSVAEALTEARRGPFDLLLCDLGLPDGDGCDLLRQLLDEAKATDRASRVKAIALTGAALDEDHVRTRAAGFAAHMAKPIDFPALLQSVRDVTGR